MQRLHISLSVESLEDSIRFYSTIFDSPPTLRKPDYAKWMLEDPLVNFSIGEGPAPGGIKHLGIQVSSEADLPGLKDRFDRADSSTFHEGETICCYHHSDKAWATDPQGVSWEGFYTSGEAAQRQVSAQDSSKPACCAPECCSSESEQVA